MTLRLAPDASRNLRQRIAGRLSRDAATAAQALADAGAPSWLLGHSRVPRRRAAEEAERCGARKVVHAAGLAAAPLPRNVGAASELPGDPGWWGFSFRDVPCRRCNATSLLTFDEIDLLSAREATGRRDYHPALLDRRGRSLELREVRYRPIHAAAPTRADRRIDEGAWIAERVYDNHSHWLTAHLAKILVLREMSLGDRLVLPAERSPVIDDSLRRLGVDVDACPTIATGERVTFGRLNLIESDRFRPELLQPVRDAIAQPGSRRRRIFVSRRRARERRLLEEEALEPMLREHGFEIVTMETLDFDAQVRLMGETAVLAAPHGAGLTNMMFCSPGTQIVEIADLGFPNPNFYALAAAMGHDYWLVPGVGAGDGHPLYRDISVAPDAVRRVIEALPS